MSRWRTLSVGEDDGRSERITAVYTGYHKFATTELRISIDDNKLLTIGNEAGILYTPGFTLRDIDDLILYLQDAKLFVEESNTVKKLLGEPTWL